MKKLISLITALLLVAMCIPALAEGTTFAFTQEDNYQLCVKFVETYEYNYNANPANHYVYMDFAVSDSIFSPDGVRMWLFAQEDGISIDVDFINTIAVNRYDEMSVLLTMLNARLSENTFYAHPDHLNVGITNYTYCVDQQPTMAQLDYTVTELYDFLVGCDVMIAKVANGGDAREAYNAFFGE